MYYWYLNNTTTDFRNNSEERKPKQESKRVNKAIAATEEHKMVKVEKDIKIVKIEVEAEVLLKKEQITKGLQNKMRKMIRTKNTLHQRNGKFNRPSKQQKNKTTFDVVVIEPIRNEETEERRQS